MIDFTEIPYDGDAWELFARDFLQEAGFFIDSTADRGADGGKDLLVTETLVGRVGRYELRWLVSCKHFATSKKAVSRDAEPDILDRMRHFKADGFIGFYSTLPSAGLNSRLHQLRENDDIRDYKIFDHKLIENMLVTVGYAHLMMRYMPASYAAIRPLHNVLKDYEPITCMICGKDLLAEMFKREDSGTLVHAYKLDDESTHTRFKLVAAVCKPECDRELRHQLRADGLTDGWNSLRDLAVPLDFLRYIFATFNQLRSGQCSYSDKAFEQEKQILISLAQRVLRPTTEKERERIEYLASMGPF